MFALPRPVRRASRLALRGIGLGLVVLVGCNVWILWQARDRSYSAVAKAPQQEVGLVLGTSPRIGSRPNLFFEGRMNAAAQLYQAGKVRHLLLSGDNGTRGYDEPTAMKEALVARGVPASALHLDSAGFRTLDSMARAKVIFGVQKVTVITDDFHLPRSLFLADSHGLEAIGFSSEHISYRWSIKTVAREAIGRVAAVIDVYLLHRQPRYYGPKEQIRLASDER